MSDVPPKLVEALRPLWQVKLGPSITFKHPLFVSLRTICAHLYPGAGGDFDGRDFALLCTLRTVGAPCVVDAADPAATPEATAQVIHRAFTDATGIRTYLCALDGADRLPTLRFGPAEVRRFTSSELEQLVAPATVKHFLPGWSFDSEQFSRFTWLLIRETYPRLPEPGRRASPIFYESLDRDFGAIQPHFQKFPAIVEEALLVLLLCPWEDCTDAAPVEWRPFRVPWIYLIDDDPCVARTSCPMPDSLSWAPDFHTDEERPYVFTLNDEMIDSTVSDIGGLWRLLQTAKQSEVVPAPLMHFVVHAFHVDGIDEFMSHIMTIEAGLGRRADFRDKKMTATQRLARRVSRLLDRDDGPLLEQLYNDRSSYVHARVMNEVSSKSRIDARRLARRVVKTLIEYAAAHPTATREDYLRALAP